MNVFKRILFCVCMVFPLSALPQYSNNELSTRIKHEYEKAASYKKWFDGQPVTENEKIYGFGFFYYVLGVKDSIIFYNQKFDRQYDCAELHNAVFVRVIVDDIVNIYHSNDEELKNMPMQSAVMTRLERHCKQR